MKITFIKKKILVEYTIHKGKSGSQSRYAYTVVSYQQNHLKSTLVDTKEEQVQQKK